MTDDLDVAFTTTPLGFDANVSSYSGADSTHAFMPGDRQHGGRGHGPNGLRGGHDFMGGGFGLDFLGGPMGGRPFERGGVSNTNCTYAAATGVNTCTDTTRDGVLVNKTIRYTTAAGTAQQTADSTTDKVVAQVTVSGTRTHRDSAKTVVNSTSNRTVTGLAYNATQRTVNGTSKGTETTTGKDSSGSFTVARVIGDTTSGIIIPITAGRPTYPTAGKVVREMKATITRTTGTTSSSRREVVTYDGSATAKLVITQDGTTKNCTIALPRGRPVCS
jgi:hypothetical protein